MSSASLWTVDVATIDRARILRGWTRRALGREAHVDEGTLCDLFAGRRRSNFGTLRAICLALGLSLQDVIRFGDDRNAERGWARLPDWLNPWWSDVRQIRSPLDQQTARNSILDASGFLKGALGRNLLGKTLTRIVVASAPALGDRTRNSGSGEPGITCIAPSRQKPLPGGHHHFLRHFCSRRTSGLPRLCDCGGGRRSSRASAVVGLSRLGGPGCSHLRGMHGLEQRCGPPR